ASSNRPRRRGRCSRPRAGRRGRLHHALQLPDDELRGEDRAGARLRQHGGREAVARRPPGGRRALPDRRRVPASGRAELREWQRARDRRGPRPLARRRHDLVHRQHGRRPARQGGGGRPSHLTRGYYVEPTLFTGARNDMTIAREEIFGPVITAIPFRDEAEAIALANDSDYGLYGYVWTGDAARGLRVARAVRTGT